jgi:hypothetical protein
MIFSGLDNPHTLSAKFSMTEFKLLHCLLQVASGKAPCNPDMAKAICIVVASIMASDGLELSSQQVWAHVHCLMSSVGDVAEHIRDEKRVVQEKIMEGVNGVVH